MDAKQRNVSVMKLPGESNEEGHLAICAEPPPDVFSALAASLAADASLKTNTTDRDIAAKLSASLSENASAIERSQTVNILREALYRTCERYQSGALSKEEFIIQAARDQRSMVQVLAIEQITGAARAQSAALTTVAKSMASGVSEASISALDGARKDSLAKAKARDAALAAATDLVPKGDCNLPLDPPPVGATADQIAAKKVKCDEHKKSVADAKSADEHYAAVKSAVARQSELSTEASGTLASSAMTATTISTEIAKQVVEIVREGNKFNEIEMTCVALIRKSMPAPHQTKILALCEKFFPQFQAAELLARTGQRADVVKLVAQARSANQEMASVIWLVIANAANTGVDSMKLNALVKKAGIELDIVESADLLRASTEGMLGMYFGGLDPNDVIKLSEAAK